MKLVHPCLTRPLVFKENKIVTFVVENQSLLGELIFELIEQIQGEEGRFVLSSGCDILDIHKNIDMVMDIFSLELNQRKLLNKLYHELKEKALQSDYYIDTVNLMGDITTYLDKLFESISYPLSHSSEMNILDVFKLAGVKLEITHESLLEKIIDYITVIQEFFGIDFFVFVNLKSYLLEEELEKLHEFLCYEKFQLLLLESVDREKRWDWEEVRIIDKDLCEI